MGKNLKENLTNMVKKVQESLKPNRSIIGTRSLREKDLRKRYGKYVKP